MPITPYTEPTMTPTRAQRRRTPLSEMSQSLPPPTRPGAAAPTPSPAMAQTAAQRQQLIQVGAQRGQQAAAAERARQADAAVAAEQARKVEDARKAEEARVAAEAARKLTIAPITNIAPATATRDAALAESAIDIARTKQLQKTAGGLRVGGQSNWEDRLKSIFG